MKCCVARKSVQYGRQTQRKPWRSDAASQITAAPLETASRVLCASPQTEVPQLAVVRTRWVNNRGLGFGDWSKAGNRGVCVAPTVIKEAVPCLLGRSELHHS